MKNTASHPLQWPEGWLRTDPKLVKSGRLSGGGYLACYEGIVKEIRLMKGDNVIISSDCPLDASGVPDVDAYYSLPKENGRVANFDNGVAVYFTLDGHQRVFACDKWSHVSSNIRAIQKTIEAIRGTERWGSSEMLTRIYDGFTVLPREEKPLPMPWWDLLGVQPHTSLDAVEQMYHLRLRQWSPSKAQSPALRRYYEEHIRFLHRAFAEAKK